MKYLIKRAKIKPELKGDWNGSAWRNANIVKVDQFRQESSDHLPITQAKVLYDSAGLYVIFRVQDCYVICTRTKNQEITSKDSCVEVYFQPMPDDPNIGYINFEMNCGGAILTYYITDPTRCDETIFKERIVIPEDEIKTLRIYHSMPKSIPVEIKEHVAWTVEYFIPFAYFEKYVGKFDVKPGTRWRGNFFKCADESSHPHWASWNPIGEEFNFHVPEYFAELVFD